MRSSTVSSQSSTSKHRETGRIAALAAAAWLASHACFWLAPGLFVPWDLKASDRLFALRTRLDCTSRPCETGVVHVDVTDSGLRALPNRQVARSEYAQVIGRLADAGATALLFDFIFASRSGAAEDDALVEAVQRAGNVYFGTVYYTAPIGGGQSPAAGAADPALARWQVRVEGPAETLPRGFEVVSNFPELERAARGVGFLNLEADVDGVFRRIPLLVRHGDTFLPGLALRAACDLLKVAPSDVVVTPGDSIRLRDIVIPIDRNGNYRVNFAGPWEAFPHQNFVTWAEARDPFAMVNLSGAIEGKPAIVADISTGRSDVGPVPTDSRYPLAGVHATVLDNILRARFVRDARPGEILAIELLLFVAITLVASRLGSWRVAAAAGLVAAAYVGAATILFLRAHVILLLVRPLMMVGFATFAIVAYRFVNEEKARAVLRESFAAYFPPAIVDRIVRDPGMVTASGRRKELTVLFSDIRGFTTRCQDMTPDDIREFLDDYFGRMIDIVFEHGGTVDKFIGDGLMVFFGDPEDQPDHAKRALDTAIAMQRAVRAMSAGAERAGKPPIQVRIGISSGVVTVGNMGSARRLSYTVLGADVNLAQRLESSAQPGGILLSGRTMALLGGTVQAYPRTLQIKGLDEPIVGYEIAPDHLDA
jgi:adenylate cyclase